MLCVTPAHGAARDSRHMRYESHSNKHSFTLIYRISRIYIEMSLFDQQKQSVEWNATNVHAPGAVQFKGN